MDDSDPNKERRGYARTWISYENEEFCLEFPDAVALLFLIQQRARFNNNMNRKRLKIHQAVIGTSDYKKMKWTEHQYIQAKKVLEEMGACTFKGVRGVGTIATLCDKIACTKRISKNHEAGTEQARSDHEAGTYNIEEIERHKRVCVSGQKKENTHTPRGGDPGVDPKSELGKLAIQAAGARDDWKLKPDAAGMEIKNCPKHLRSEAVQQFTADAANMVDPWPNPLGMLRKYMSYADFHSSKNGSGEKKQGGRSSVDDRRFEIL